MGSNVSVGLPVKIGSGCWIGGGVIILPGVTIGDDCKRPYRSQSRVHMEVSQSEVRQMLLRIYILLPITEKLLSKSESSFSSVINTQTGTSQTNAVPLPASQIYAR